MKYDVLKFVSDILANDKLTPVDKQKIIELAKRDVSNFSLNAETLSEKVEKVEVKIEVIEEKMGMKTTLPTINLNNSKDSESKTVVKNHSPKTMVKFLYSFSIDEKFKWFTHNPEGLITDFNYLIYLEIAKNEYDKTTGWNINNVTYNNVKNFIINTGDKFKTNIFNKGNIAYSWRDFEKWCGEHPNTHPYSAEINGDYFKKYINQFKQIIEFRTDVSDLTFNIRVRKLIRDLLGVDFIPHFTKSFNEIGQSVKIFCDVNLLFNSIKQIIEWIVLNKAKSNEVEINLVESDDFYQLEIIHKKSYFTIAPNDNKLNGLSGDFDKTRKMLFSVADWEIITTIKNNGLTDEYRIICLNDNIKLINNILSPNSIEKTNEKNNYVKHILKLYKTQNL